MGKNVWYFAKQWPRERVSAGILKSLKKMNYHINFICSQTNHSSYDDNLKILDIDCFNSDINDSDSFNNLKVKLEKPSICFYDTFIAEEYFSHYVYDNFPDVPSILDTQDLHFLRDLRKFYYKKINSNELFYNILINNKEKSELLQEYLFKNNNTFLRELSSLIRADHIILCSDLERLLLNCILPKVFSNKISNLTFFYDELNHEVEVPCFENRKDFIFLGNFQHNPNRDSLFLVKEMWTKLIKMFDKNEEKPNLHIYGANMDGNIKSIENISQNIYVHGVLPKTKSIENFRIMLCPLVYGAGIKGKITDSWYYSTPCISSFMGSEGLFLDEIEVETKLYHGKNIIERLNYIFNSYAEKMLYESKDKWGGFYSNNIDDLVIKSYELYKNKDLWIQKVDIGKNIIKKRMSFDYNYGIFGKMIENIYVERNDNDDLYRRILMNENTRTTKYMSKYIEIKNKHP